MRAILEVLGVDRLQLVLSQMQYALKEGNQQFVLAYALFDCVAAVRPSVHLAPEDVGFLFAALTRSPRRRSPSRG